MHAQRSRDLAERVQFRVRAAVFDPADQFLEQASAGRERVLRKTLGRSQPPQAGSLPAPP
jgi:hypothetical protein